MGLMGDSSESHGPLERVTFDNRWLTLFGFSGCRSWMPALLTPLSFVDPMNEMLKPQIKEAIVRSLRLTMSPSEIEDAIPLFGEGLGLDSIDALELVLELERTFGVRIKDEEVGNRVLRSVNSIAEFIEATGSGPV